MELWIKHHQGTVSLALVGCFACRMSKPVFGSIQQRTKNKLGPQSETKVEEEPQAVCSSEKLR